MGFFNIHSFLKKSIFLGFSLDELYFLRFLRIFLLSSTNQVH